jgi:SAM-dependent methyltransferase
MEPLISILVPLYNEEEFVGTLLERVLAAPLPPGYGREVIVVDDGSSDGTATAVEQLVARFPGSIRLIRLTRNQGKGAAVRRAAEEAQGEFCIIQDADLEYGPGDYAQMFQPLLDGVADVVYGSRFVSRGRRRVLLCGHSIANRLLTELCNAVADLNLTDMETCYKAFRTSLLKSIPIRSQRFGMEPEVTIKIAKRQARIYEVPISYEGRTYDEGKKIRFKDAVQALCVIFRYALTSDLYTDPGAGILDAFSVAPRFNQWMADTIRPYVGRRVLEFGAGMGNLTRLLSPRTKRYVASDIDTDHVARLKARLKHHVTLETHAGDLAQSEDFERFRESMDTTICLNVMEHIDDDLGCARNMYSALAPGGRAIILVPQGQNIFGRLDTVLGHRRRYSRESLRSVLIQAGFTMERMIGFNRISWPVWYFSGRVLKSSRLRRWPLRVFDASVFLWRRIDRFLPFPPTSLIAIVQKPLTADIAATAADERRVPVTMLCDPDSNAEAFDSPLGQDRAPRR